MYFRDLCHVSPPVILWQLNSVEAPIILTKITLDLFEQTNDDDPALLKLW